MTHELSDADFETAYDLIARAIDRAEPADERLFLARLCLLLARQAGELTVVEAAIENALIDTRDAPGASGGR